MKRKNDDRFGTNSQNSGNSGNGIEKSFAPEVKQDLMYNSRDNQLRSTYTTKIPLR